MNNDLNALKNWFKNLGLEIDCKIKDEDLKKLMAPQLRDVWRNMIKHVRPKEEVDLIKKTILLHKLQKHQKPLMVKVETDEDLVNALKYEELITKRNKIEKNIMELKINNDKMKNDLIKKSEYKSNLLKEVEIIQNKCYITKHNIQNYNTFIDVLNETTDLCNHFSTSANEMLTKTDYEDSLIKCFIEVDNAKQFDKINDCINIGTDLCNALYTIISDKSPSVLLQNIEQNLTTHIKLCDDIITEPKSTTPHHNDDDDLYYNELLVKLFKKQLELKSKLSNSLTKKQCAIEKLKNTTHFVINEILNLYKLKNISCTDNELKEFKIKLKEFLQFIVKNSIDSIEKITFPENIILEKKKDLFLNELIDRIKVLNQEIDEKRMNVSVMATLLSDKKCEFGLMEVKMCFNKLAEYYLVQMNKKNPLDSTIKSIKDRSSSDINETNNIPMKSIPKLKLQTLQNIKQYSEMVNFIKEMTTKFEEFNSKVSVKNNIIDDISQKELMHKTEFDNIVSEIENNILELDSSIKDTQLVAKKVMNKD